MKINYLDLFSGIGGFAYGLNMAGIEFDYHAFSEIDPYATKVYRRHFPDAIPLGSVADVSGQGLPRLDLITFGWPCQDNSIAGKRKGQKDGTRSGLLTQAARIIGVTKPKYFVAENVPGLYSVNSGRDFYESIRLLAYLSGSLPQYSIQMQLLNTIWFLPQLRERLYFVGHIRGESRPEVFPIRESDAGNIEKVQKRVIIRGRNRNAVGCLDTRGVNAFDRSDLDKLIYLALIPEATKKGYALAKEGDSINLSNPNSKTRRGRVGVGVANTIDTQMQQYTIQAGGIRRLTPIETERLQGFPDNWTKWGVDGKEISDTQRYKCCGNAVSVPVVKAVVEKLYCKITTRR